MHLNIPTKMKKHWREILVLMLLIILATFVLSVILGAISANKIKLLYPIVIAVLFIPSVFMYYNESALIHEVWR